ncbi:MAG TPA: BrnT family toxin [Thiolinea sp.]|nr:BrnT family toxin [Thiolinea sp.]
MEFEWDENKDHSNLRKHGVSFETAARVFADPFHVSIQDRIENGEERWQTLGLVEGRTLLLVAHLVWNEDDHTEVIRIISARKAAPKERTLYEQENRNR